jgi:hypothetical protein
MRRWGSTSFSAFLTVKRLAGANGRRCQSLVLTAIPKFGLTRKALDYKKIMLFNEDPKFPSVTKLPS